MVELLKILQPNATTIPGSVIRDLFIELPASTVSLLYDELSTVSDLQSLRSVAGSDLDNLLSNYGITRKFAAKASGLALLTFSSLPAIVSVNKGDLLFSSSGVSFSVVNGVSVNPSNSNLYRSIATKFKNDLDFLNITDTFAVEITVQATTPGSIGNIAKYGLVRANIPGISNVTNVFAFTGGSNQEDDASYRNRGLAIFSGSSTGTSLGYRNTALTNSNVLDAVVIEPGDPLMTRDGTVVSTNENGISTIISEGTGGKVDIVILGSLLSEFTDSFIYQDKSNNNKPADSKNDRVLGQIIGDENKTISRRRIDNIKNGVLPAQPVEKLLEVVGSLSGANFRAKSIDNLGIVTGNYELIKDTGTVSGSPFGFDKFHWISDKISLFEEDRVKSKFNGQDSTTFTDVLQIPKIQQSVSITNENSLVLSSDRSIVQLLHLPATGVTRVFNVNTGERYTVIDQNVDGNDTLNTTGRIRISGSTLPTTSDVLQVDYTWIVDFDGFVDYDGKIIKNNPRDSRDSIDWGLSNAVRNELVTFMKSADGAFYTGNVKHPISVVLSANSFKQANGIVTKVLIGNLAGRLSVVISSLVAELTSVNSVMLKNGTLEIYNTNNADGLFSNERVVVGSDIRYVATIILPTDTPAKEGQLTTVFFNQKDTFTVGTATGSFTANQITIPSTNVSVPDQTVLLRVNYLTSIQEALTVTTVNLPVSRSGNSFILNNSFGFTNTIVSNTVRRENQTVQFNALNQLSIKLSITSTDFTFSSDSVITVVNLTNNKEIWNTDNAGTVTTDSNNNYILVFTAFNAPKVGDNVVVFYTVSDIKRTQPFTFDSNIIKYDIQQLQLDTITNQLFVKLNNFTTASNISFSIIDPTTNSIIASSTGTLTAGVDNATISGTVVVFDDIDEILLKNVRVKNSIFPNNNGLYSITAINTNSNTITLSSNLNNLNSNQISVVRLLDNKDLWTNAATIDVINNKLILPVGASANANDNVIVLKSVSNNLRQAPSRLSVTVSDQINNTGIVSIAGTTLTKVADVVFTATNGGFKQNIAEAVKNFLKLTSVASIPSTISLARITKLEKVTTTTDGTVISSDFRYDVLGSSIKDNVFYANEMIDDDVLGVLDFIIPSTTNNLTNIPKLGDKFRITFYYSNTDDSEGIAFTRNGTLYSNKIFAFLNKIYISSGFTSTSARFTFSYFNQPATGSRYKIFYDYTAPKQNERISIKYNYNQLITSTTFAIETTRPINADVLVKAAKQMLVDLTMKVVIKTEFINSSATVLQNLKDRLITAINTNKLADTLDASDLVSVASSVDGIDRARVTFFNQNGKTGQVLSLVGAKNQYFTANNIVVNVETR